MRAIVMSFLVISIVANAKTALPLWATSSPTTSKEGLPIVICDGEALSPGEAENTARAACLTAGAQTKGVALTVQSKTTMSMGGTDSSQVSEITPLHAKLRCDFTNRFLEELPAAGYRVWLQCVVHELQIEKNNPIIKEVEPVKLLPFSRASLTVTSIPQPDVIIVSGSNGDRVIEIPSNSTSIVLKEGDNAVTVKKLGFKDSIKSLETWKNGDLLTLDFKLQRDR